MFCLFASRFPQTVTCAVSSSMPWRPSYKKQNKWRISIPFSVWISVMQQASSLILIIINTKQLLQLKEHTAQVSWRYNCCLKSLDTMARSSFVFCTQLCTISYFLLLYSTASLASVIPREALNTPSELAGIAITDKNGMQHEELETSHATSSKLPNSFALISSNEFSITFENGTSLLTGIMQKRFQRVKREVCKERPVSFSFPIEINQVFLR